MSENKLTSNVFIDGVWYGPSYPHAGDPPADSVTNDTVWDGADLDEGETHPTVMTPAQQVMGHGQDGAPPEAAGPPPKSGPGSSDAVWRSYARSQGVEVTEDMRRKQVIEACSSAGVTTDGDRDQAKSADAEPPARSRHSLRQGKDESEQRTE